MLLDARQYAFARALEENHDIIRADFDRLTREDFMIWPDRPAYGGDWLVAPLFMSSHFPGIEHTFAVNQAKCPATTAILRSISGVTAAVFSWQEPGCHIYAHRDVKALAVLRAHLGLEVPGGAVMRVGPDMHTWHEGQSLLFDGYIDHETGNQSNGRRVVLLVDAVVRDDEFENLKAWREQHDVFVDPSLVLVHPFTRDTQAPSAQ